MGSVGDTGEGLQSVLVTLAGHAEGPARPAVEAGEGRTRPAELFLSNCPVLTAPDRQLGLPMAVADKDYRIVIRGGEKRGRGVRAMMVDTVHRHVCRELNGRFGDGIARHIGQRAVRQPEHRLHGLDRQPSDRRPARRVLDRRSCSHTAAIRPPSKSAAAAFRVAPPIPTIVDIPTFGDLWQRPDGGKR